MYKAFALVPNFQRVWQAAVSRCTRVDQAAILLKVLESSILWKSWLSGALSSRYKEDHMMFTLLKRRFVRHAREYLMKTEVKVRQGVLLIVTADSGGQRPLRIQRAMDFGGRGAGAASY